MPSVALTRLTACCDRLLQAGEIEDWAGAVNGLQVANRGKIHRLAAAVDASVATVRMAVEAGADLMLVHHGLFWGPSHPWTGRRYELLRLLLDHDVAVYSSHLPLDVHPRLGNNARLCAALGFRQPKPFFFSRGANLGLRVNRRIQRDELVTRLKAAVEGPVRLLPGGTPVCRAIGVVTGGAGAELNLAAAEGIDTFITGEGPHWTYAMAEDLGINVLYAGHYATETFGVRALAEHLAEKFKLPWVFLDHPTGL